jgi:uncharacterized membrane protein
MMSQSTHLSTTSRTRLLVSLAAGVAAAMLCIVLGVASFTALAAWDATVLTYGVWLWATVWHMSPGATKSHAVRENPGRVLADSLLLLASVASIGAVGILIIDASSATGAMKAADIIVGLVSIVLSWAMVHTTYMLKYARQYYGQPEGGVSFNERDSPRYQDFAYLAFTLGMTFQVSDTDLQTNDIRGTALKHALLSYLCGTVIIATTINTLASLSK